VVYERPIAVDVIVGLWVRRIALQLDRRQLPRGNVVDDLGEEL